MFKLMGYQVQVDGYTCSRMASRSCCSCEWRRRCVVSGAPVRVPTRPPDPPTRIRPLPLTRGLHSSTFELNLSAFCGIGLH